MENRVLIHPPFHLVSGDTICRHCDHHFQAVALIAGGWDGQPHEPCLVSHVEALPDDLLRFIQLRFPGYHREITEWVRGGYFANACPECGEFEGDSYFHGLDETFEPEDCGEAAKMRLEEVPIAGSLDIRAEVAHGHPSIDLMLEFAAHVSP